MSVDPLLQLRLRDGLPARLRLARDATVLAVGEADVFSFDLAGRPYALVHGGLTWRRALDGRFLVKGRSSPAGGLVRERVEARGGAPVMAAARAWALDFAAVLEASPPQLPPAVHDQALRRLGAIGGMDAVGLEGDVARYRSVYAGGIAILPPDQYLSLVVQLTEGCSWNACTFCDLHGEKGFRVKSPSELRAHLEALRSFFGPGLALRRTLFLGDANALCVAHERLLPLLEQVTAAFPVAPRGLVARARAAWLDEAPQRMGALFSFVDVLTGARKTVEQYRDYARLGLRRVYVGVESGDAELLRWLDKPGSAEEACRLVATLREAGVAVGVIILLGAGGETFFASHATRTAALLRRLRLGADDLLYFSELVSTAGLRYAARARRDGIRPLGASRLEEQRRLMLQGLGNADQAAPRVARYDLREFVY